MVSHMKAAFTNQVWARGGGAAHLGRTGEIIIQEENLTLQKHQQNPTKWHLKLKTKIQTH